jgi:hypothetical protein
MKIYIKNIECQGTRFFVIQNQGNLGYNTFKLDKMNSVNDLSSADKEEIVKSLQENILESKFAGSIIKSEIRFLLFGWN